MSIRLRKQQLMNIHSWLGSDSVHWVTVQCADSWTALVSLWQMDPSRTATTTAASSPPTPAARCSTECLQRPNASTCSVHQWAPYHSLLHHNLNPNFSSFGCIHTELLPLLRDEGVVVVLSWGVRNKSHKLVGKTSGRNVALLEACLHLRPSSVVPTSTVAALDLQWRVSSCEPY